MRPKKDTGSIGGTLTGRGGNFIIIDDPLKPEEAMSKTVRVDHGVHIGPAAVEFRMDGKFHRRNIFAFDQ